MWLREHWLTWLLCGFAFGAMGILLWWALLEPEAIYPPIIWFGKTVL